MNWLADQVEVLAKQASVSLCTSLLQHNRPVRLIHVAELPSVPALHPPQEISMYDVKSAVNKVSLCLL